MQIRKFIYLGLGAILLVMLLIFSPFSNNDSGYRSHVQTASGTEFIRFDPGWYWSGFFSKVTEYPDVITIQFAPENDRQEDITYSSDTIKCQFSDGTYAQIGFTVKWKLPYNDSLMIRIHKDYRSGKRLARSLADYSRECMNYSTPMMDSERHYSGGKSELAEHFKFQLRNGQYILEQRESVTKDTSGNVRRDYQNYPKVDSTGHILLTKSDVQRYGIDPNFVAITLVDYEPAVDKKLKAKVDQSTQESVSKQTLMTAQQEALTAKATGEKMIAEAKATADAEKMTAVIAKEKEVELSRLASQQAKYEAEKVKYEGDALAAKNRALVSAGLTPLEKATINKETAIGVAAELAKIQFPQFMIFGNDKGGPTDPFQALGLQSFMQVQDALNARQK